MAENNGRVIYSHPSRDWDRNYGVRIHKTTLSDSGAPTTVKVRARRRSGAAPDLGRLCYSPPLRPAFGCERASTRLHAVSCRGRKSALACSPWAPPPPALQPPPPHQVFDQVNLDASYALWPPDRLEYSAVGLDVGYW